MYPCSSMSSTYSLQKCVVCLDIDFCDFSSVQDLNSKSQVNIFPNPATDQFVVKSSLFGENTTLEIFNLLGEKIYTSAYRQQLTVRCEHFPRGIYFVRLRNSEKQLTQMLIVE